MCFEVIMKTFIDLPDQQLTVLGVICERENCSLSEAIRRAVDDWLDARLTAERASVFGAWVGGENSRKIVQELRGEWD